MIELQNVTHKSGEKQILQDVNCIFLNGHTTALLGYNGAGKTTMLDVCMRFVSPQIGRVIWQDNITKKDIGFVSQKTVFLNRSVQENIEYIRHAFGFFCDKTLRYSSQLIEQLQLGELLSQNALTLSEGEKKRLALLLAIIHNPKILLLDEPCANLDPENNDVIENLILEQKKHKKTIIMVSHQMKQIQKICDRICFLHKGCVVEQGDIKTVIDHPVSPMTHRYYQGL